MNNSPAFIKQELDLTNLSISPIPIISSDELEDLHVSWAEEAPEFINSSIASSTKVNSENDATPPPPIKSEFEDMEIKIKPSPTPSSGRKVIPFDYEHFCSDIPENMLPIFKGCSMQMKPNPTSNSAGQFLTVPKANYGGRKHRSVQSWNDKKCESSLHSAVCPSRRSTDSNSNYNQIKEEVEDDFKIKKPMKLQSKRILPPPSPEITDNYCAIM